MEHLMGINFASISSEKKTVALMPLIKKSNDLHKDRDKIVLKVRLGFRDVRKRKST